MSGGGGGPVPLHTFSACGEGDNVSMIWMPRGGEGVHTHHFYMSIRRIIKAPMKLTLQDQTPGSFRIPAYGVESSPHMHAQLYAWDLFHA